MELSVKFQKRSSYSKAVALGKPFYLSHVLMDIVDRMNTDVLEVTA